MHMYMHMHSSQLGSRYMGDAWPSASQLISCNWFVCPWHLLSSGYPITHSVANYLAIKILGIANTYTHTPPNPPPTHLFVNLLSDLCFIVLLELSNQCSQSLSPPLLLLCQMPSQFQFILQYMPAAPNLQCPERGERGREGGRREEREGRGGERVRKLTDCPIWVHKYTFSLCLFLSNIRWTLSVHLHSL